MNVRCDFCAEVVIYASMICGFHLVLSGPLTGLSREWSCYMQDRQKY